MDAEMGTAVFTLLYTIGEMLTQTWPGRCVLGIAVVATISRLARA